MLSSFPSSLICLSFLKEDKDKTSEDVTMSFPWSPPASSTRKRISTSGVGWWRGFTRKTTHWHALGEQSMLSIWAFSYGSYGVTAPWGSDIQTLKAWTLLKGLPGEGPCRCVAFLLILFWWMRQTAIERAWKRANTHGTQQFILAYKRSAGTELYKHTFHRPQIPQGVWQRSTNTQV